MDSVEDKTSSSTYKTYNTYEDVSFSERVEGNTLSPTIDGTGRKGCKT